MARSIRALPVRGLIWVLMGAVVIPAILSIAVGVVALALSQQAVDIVVGVLVLCFAVSAITGGFVAFGLLKRGERLSQMQSDFVANVSHDLRTPVAGIRVLAEALARGRTSEPGKTEEVGGLILAEAQRLQELVERILRWRQLTAGATVIEVEPQPLAPVVASALQPYQHGQRVKIDVAEDLPPVRIDSSAMVDVLRNLVDNALKFGGDEPIEVVGRTEGDEVVLEVRDQGPGIPKSERHRIFERFYRVPVHMRAKQGAGLGLSIVKALTEAQGGRVEVHSEPGIGSAFFVRLKVADEP